MWDQSGSMSGPSHWELGPEYKKLINDYMAKQKDQMTKRIRCSFCSQVVKVETIFGKEVLERHVYDPHGASGGQNCVGSGKAIDASVANLLQEARRKARNKFYPSELDMPKNIAEDHKAFRDIINSEPVKMKLKEKIKNGTIFHQGRVRRVEKVEKNEEPYKCPRCGGSTYTMDCFYGDCTPKAKYKPIKCSVEILED